jgi:hypothetical protein
MAQKKFLWTIVRRFLQFSTIFEYFGWKRELYPILHEDHENQVLFCVSSMVTKLQALLETGSTERRWFLQICKMSFVP